MAVVRRAQPAMATRFEAILQGDDAEHLEAVCTLVFEEIDRVERLLSRFDPASEVSRVNRLASAQAVRISLELAEVLEQCRQWHDLTESTFDIVAAREGGRRLGWSDIELDTPNRTVTFRTPHAIFDFGGFGKGYALDRAHAILEQYGVENALLHGGTSSILGQGRNLETDLPWQASVGLGASQQTVELPDLALSTSATVDEHNSPCEVVDPRTGNLVPGRRSCFVIAETAALAEILSTALLVAGHGAAHWRQKWQEEGDRRVRRVGWYEGEHGYEKYTEGLSRSR